MRQFLACLDSGAAPSDTELLAMLRSPALDTGLDHWELWTLVGLARHVPRQQWVRQVIQTHLNADPARIARFGSLGHPEGVPAGGVVPDEPGWGYYFHGCGCCLTSVRDGTCVDVDFTGEGSAEAVDPYFYSRFLESLKMPALPERLLRKQEPLEDAWQADVTRLVAAGIVTKHHRLTLTSLAGDIAAAIQPLIERMDEWSACGSRTSRRKLGLAALALNDVVLAQETLEATDDTAGFRQELDRRSGAVAERRADYLQQVIERKQGMPTAELAALAALGRERSRTVLKEALFRTPVDGMANMALAIVGSWNHEEVGPLLNQLLSHRYREAFGIASRLERLWRSRSRCDDSSPRGSQVVRLLTEILRRVDPIALPKETRQRMVLLGRQVVGANAGEAALVVYALDRQAGLGALKTALACRVPLACQDAGAACALIGTDDAKALLVEALNSPNVMVQHHAACALGKFGDDEARALVGAWARRNDGIKDPLGKELRMGDRTIQAYTLDDLEHANMDVFFAARLERLRHTFSSIIARFAE